MFFFNKIFFKIQTFLTTISKNFETNHQKISEPSSLPSSQKSENQIYERQKTADILLSSLEIDDKVAEKMK